MNQRQASFALFLPSAVLVLFSLSLCSFNMLWSFRGGHRWATFRKMRIYAAHIDEIRSAHVEGPQREHRQKSGEGFAENFVQDQHDR
jgi:hypothetical protein